MRLLNGTVRAAAAVGLRRGPITAEAALRSARRRTGLADLGGGGIEEPLHVLAESFENEARLSPFGRGCVRALLRTLVERRLRIVDAARRDPSVEQAAVLRPLVVVGLPRTGTTLLQNLLAAHPAARPLLSWEAHDPLPAPDGSTTRRRRRLARAVRALDYLAPDFRTVHDIPADGPEECLLLLERTLVSWAFLLHGRLPGYQDWLWRRDRPALEEAYRFYRLQLLLMQRQDGGPAGDRSHWVLKCPAHLNALHALVQVLPGACIVQTHRDPADVLPSACSLLAVSRSILSDQVDPLELGRDLVESGRRSLVRNREVRSEIPPERIVDVAYEDLVADPVATVRRIHDRFGFDVPPDHDDRVRDRLAATPASRHGPHRYSLAQFGLTAEMVREIDPGAIA